MHNKKYADYLYKRLSRNGALYRDCQRMVNQDRNMFAACMVACGDADAMVTGLTRNTPTCWNDLARAISIEKGQQLFGLTVVSARDRTVFIADTLVHERPTAEQLADFATQSAAKARELGHEPRVALLSHTSFGGRSSNITKQATTQASGRGRGRPPSWSAGSSPPCTRACSRARPSRPCASRGARSPTAPSTRA